jgi:ubiquinone/menaquinone biosynthesis C-methylase UbiE
LIDAELRNFEITNKAGAMLDSNRQIWQSLGIKQTENALFFPAPNALVPLRFAKFMNKRKVTFVDTNDVNVGTLISLAADLKLSNVTVKLASPKGKFPISDGSHDVVYSDLGFSTFLQDHKVDIDVLTKELIRILKPGGKLAALDENGAPVMYPCPVEIQTIKTKIDAPRADKLVMGRRIYGTFKSNGLKNIKLFGYSRFVTSDDQELLRSELSRRIALLDLQEHSPQSSSKGIVSPQESEKYKAWLKSQMSNDSFMIQFNTILAVAEK